jgi:flagellar basal body rod protein FlgG
VLERSNVQPFNALTHMMYITRSIEGTNKFISTMYTLERKASDTLAKIYS